jgi:hypothetical protein
MYRHVRNQPRPIRNDPDPSEILEAAGVNPIETPEFVREVKFAVKRGGKETKNCSELAHYLNDHNVYNARGYPWTPAAIKAFIGRYLPKGRP